MIRLKLLIRVAVSLIFLSTALTASIFGRIAGEQPAFAYDAGEDVSGSGYKDSGSTLPVSSGQTVPASLTPQSGSESPLNNECPPDSKPYFVNFVDSDSMFICFAGIIRDTFIVNDSNTGQTVAITMLSGPGTFSSIPGVPPVYGYYSYTPQSEGDFQITLMAKDSRGDSTIVTRTYHVFINEPPFITTGDTSFFHCFGGSYFSLNIMATDPENDVIRYELLSYQADIDPLTGRLTFWAAGPGVYCHTVVASDGCGGDTAQICVTVVHNTSPIFDNPDQTFKICEPDTICFEVIARDPDINDSVEIMQLSGPGVFHMISDSSGRTCFLPDDVDSASYMFIYQATDNCLREFYSKDEACPPIPIDTVIITVVKGGGFTLNCPGDTSLFICNPDTLCFPIEAIPEGAIVTVSPPSAWYDSASQTICFYTNCRVRKDLRIKVESACGTDSCRFAVDVKMNLSPLVIMAPDTSLYSCALQEICMPAGITDVDDNIKDIIVLPQGHYDPMTGKVCFMPTAAGINTVIVKAIDSCGAEDVDSTRVNVRLNSEPTISAPADTSFKLCNPVEICIPISISDADNNILNVSILPFGRYDSVNGKVCFTPISAGTYDIEIIATDSCGATDSSSIRVKVDLNQAPLVISVPDTSIFMCILEQICFPITIADPDNDVKSVRVIGQGQYANGYVCFTPSAEGDYTIIVEAVDQCDNIGTDTTRISVRLNSPPVVVSANDFDASQCDFQEICFDVDVSDPDNNIQVVSTTLGYYDSDNSRICFTPTAAGTYIIIVTATDFCYSSRSDTTVIKVETSEKAVIDCPEGPIQKSLCGQASVCYPLIITPANAAVTVSYGTYADGQLCFNADTTGIYNIRVIADANCGSDTCDIVFEVNVGQVPQLSCPADTAIELCGTEEVCLPVGLIPLGARVTVFPIGIYEDGKVCFNVDSSGHYTISLKAETDCGIDSCTFDVDIAFNRAPEIVTKDTVVFACEPGQNIIYGIEAVDFENNEIRYSLISAFGHIDSLSGMLSIVADTAGEYCFTVMAADSCAADTAGICITVDLNHAPVVVSADDLSTKLCLLQEVCFPVSVTDADGNITSIDVNMGGGQTARYADGYVCFDPQGSGSYVIIVSVSDSCGAVDSDTTIVDVQLNAPPVVIAPEDFEAGLCRIEDVCFDVNVIDPDNNIQNVSTNIGSYDGQTGKVCFLPEGPGNYKIIITASDSCYISGIDTVDIDVVIGEAAQIDCPPDPVGVFLCNPGQYCLPLNIAPADAEVTASFGTYADGSLCFPADTSGTYHVRVIAESECGSDICDIVFEVTIGETVALVCPNDTLIILCAPETICRSISVEPLDAEVVVTPVGYFMDGTFCFTPDTAGHYEFTVIASKDCSIDSCYFTVDIAYNKPPEIVSTDTGLFSCEPVGVFTYDINARDFEGDLISYRLLSGNGSIDSLTGLIRLTADTAGIYCFSVEASDYCGADTADVCINIAINSAPDVSSESDMTVVACTWEEICIAVAVSDIDENIVSILSNIGSYFDGEVCFVPAEAGDYIIITTATDQCGEKDTDTTVVTVKAGELLSLDCPHDTSVFICNPDTLCFPVGGVPVNATITVTPSSAWYDAAQGTICFYTNCSVKKDLKIVAQNECFSDSCNFRVNVTMNSQPLVIMPPDTNVSFCQLQEICLPVGISDIDSNIASIIVSPGATYNPFTGKICFTPTEAGKHVIKTRALDACGAADLDSTIVYVNLNLPPLVVAAPDFDIFQCDLAEICLPVAISDPDHNIARVTVSPSGTYNPSSGNVCFTPTSAGLHQFVITATDSCGFVGVDTARIDVKLNSAPVVDAGRDTTIISCSRTTLCLPVTVTDIDDNIASITATGGAYFGGYVCFSTSDSGIFNIIVTAIDSCGAKDIDTVVVNVNINHAPVVISANDTSVFQCIFEEVCFNVSVSDVEQNIQTISTNIGTYHSESGTVCFTPAAAGEYFVITTASDECGRTGVDTTVVTVTTGDAALIVCPEEPIIDTICQKENICYPLTITPLNAVITTSFGEYENGQLCFFPDSSGTYRINVEAVAPCGTDECTIEFIVVIGEAAYVSCPVDTTVFLCDPASICIPVQVTPAYARVTILPTGSYSDGKVCFDADTAGTYLITVIGKTYCGYDTCQTRVEVGFDLPPHVNAGIDTTYFQCQFQEVCRPVTITDADNGIDSVKVSPVGYYDSQSKTICFLPDRIGTQCLTVTAYDECGEKGVDTVCITVTTGLVADIQCPTGPISRRLCDPGQVCFPLTIIPASATITVSYGVYVDGQVCFYADTAGVYKIKAIAAEACGSDTCVITVNVAFDAYANIGCPDLPISASLCSPGNVSVTIPITPSTATLTIKPIGSYDFVTKLLTFRADTAGTYKITIIAATPCNADTCLVQINVAMNQIPVVTCPGNIDTLVCLPDINEICFPVSVVGSGVTAKVLPDGNYSGGMVCYPITVAGTFPVSVIASNLCGADTCGLTITVRDNKPPVLILPSDTVLLPWCDDDTGEICISGIFAEDPENDPITITKICGPGTYAPARPDSGSICFRPDNADTTYEFCLKVEDGCTSSLKSMFLTTYQSATCSVCVDVAIQTDSCVVVGSSVPVKVMVQTNDPIGGFDLLIGYDASVLSFQYAIKGSAISGWEYFTYRLDSEGDCGSGCPSGLLRLVAIADQNNGPFHPPESQYNPSGVLAQIQMRVANNQNLGGLYLPISFHWLDCGDNTFSNRTGEQLLVDARIYNGFGNVIWDEFDEILFPETNRPDGLGAWDSCIIGDKISPIRCVYFHNGGICVKHPDSIDARGDINLNGVAYEIADAVVFTNYFIYGLGAFITNVDGQIAATDVNADGFTLTVADLVYLVRVIVGDADAIHKPSPDMLTLELATQNRDNILTVDADAGCAMGAGYLIFRYDGIQPEIPELGTLAEGMDVIYTMNDGEIRVLIYSFNARQAISAGDGNILTIKYNGSGSIKLVESSFASFHGNAMKTNMGSALLPDRFDVSQNYPNPFNPATSIDLSLPVSCHWQITIYNINGQTIKRFENDGGPGIVTVIWNGRNSNEQPVASGVYFYKAEIAGYSITKKMTLLK